jgi:hypothetical protein
VSVFEDSANRFQILQHKQVMRVQLRIPQHALRHTDDLVIGDVLEDTDEGGQLLDLHELRLLVIDHAHEQFGHSAQIVLKELSCKDTFFFVAVNELVLQQLVEPLGRDWLVAFEGLLVGFEKSVKVAPQLL